MSLVTDTALSLVGAQLVRRAKWMYLGYGVAAYMGLRVLKHYNVMPRQTDQALSLIERMAGHQRRPDANATV